MFLKEFNLDALNVSYSKMITPVWNPNDNIIGTH